MDWQLTPSRFCPKSRTTSTIIQHNISTNQLLQNIKMSRWSLWFIQTRGICNHRSYAAAKAHVPHAKRNNCKIQECVQATYHGLPYNHSPHILVKYLVTEAARKLNFSKQSWCLKILQSADDSPSREHRLHLPLQTCTKRLCTSTWQKWSQEYNSSTHAWLFVSSSHIKQTRGPWTPDWLCHHETQSHFSPSNTIHHQPSTCIGMPWGHASRFKITSRTNQILFDLIV